MFSVENFASFDSKFSAEAQLLAILCIRADEVVRRMHPQVMLIIILIIIIIIIRIVIRKRHVNDSIENFCCKMQKFSIAVDL